MPAKAQELASSLAGGLKPAYLVSGDETLLVEEACDQVLAAARQAGFTERCVMHVEAGFKWHDLTQEAASMSLFAEKKVLDLRVPANKFDKQASAVLREYLADANGDNLLLIRTARLQSRQRSSAWFKALDKAGVTVLVWPIGQRELPGWLAHRARSAGLQLTRDAVDWLADRVEGNLLAAAQEIEKLKLAGLEQPVDAQALAASVADASHYDSFELIDAVFAGDARRVRRVLRVLRQEGVSLFALLGAFTSQLRGIESGRWMPPQRQRLIPGFLRRVGSVERVLSQLALVDQQGKGELHGDVWISFERLLLRVCGMRLPSLEREARYLWRQFN